MESIQERAKFEQEKVKNEMKLAIRSKASNEAFGRSVVALFAIQLDPTLEELAEIKTAVSEAVTNAIVHAYDDELGLIYIYATIVENEIQIKIVDKGKGIENVELAMQPMYTTKPEEERSGMGFLVMGTFMDYVSTESELGVGTTVQLRKKIGTR